MAEPEKKRWLRVLYYALAIAAAILIGVGGFFAFILYELINDPFNDREFDQVVWMSFHESIEADNPRGNMAYDIIDRLKSGMSRADVLTLLGTPDFDEQANCLSYNLGMWSGFRIDYDSLDIFFDDSGNFSYAVIVQH